MSTMSVLILIGTICFLFQLGLFIVFGIHIVSQTSKIPELLSTVNRMSAALNQIIINKLESDFHSMLDSSSESEPPMMKKPTIMLYRSIDGKHSAATLEELIQKIMNDPTREKSSDESGMKYLKNFFEELPPEAGTNQDDKFLNDDDEDEDDDEHDINWKQ